MLTYLYVHPDDRTHTTGIASCWSQRFPLGNVMCRLEQKQNWDTQWWEPQIWCSRVSYRLLLQQSVRKLWTFYYRTQVSRLGTGSFILMSNILLSLIALGAPLNCDDANELLSLVKPFDPHRLEAVRVIIAHTDPVCFEDAKADWRNGLINLILSGATKWHKSHTEVSSTIPTETKLSRLTRSI